MNDSPSANQRRTEPVPPAPGHGVPDAAGGDDVAPAAGAGSSPGDARGVSVPSGSAAGLTSEASPPVDGVAVPAVAPPAHADGETDTRTPPTTSY
jgi:hypothetical protein